MIEFDFYINRIEDGGALVTEKRTRRHAGDVTLDQYLKVSDVPDAEIGAAIESLEALPYGAAQAEVTGRNGIIIIKQVTK